MDYSSLINSSDIYFPSWEKFYDFNLSYPENIKNIIKQSVTLPYDNYDIVVAYALIPSALAKKVPYLYCVGESNSGKSTIGKIIAFMYGVKPTSSNTSYAAIRNILNERRIKWVTVYPEPESSSLPYPKQYEANTIMVWEDISPKSFRENSHIYNMFKFGYDKNCDEIEISSINQGTNDKFHCFCTKVLSTIHPIHTMEEFKELRRRLLPIATAKVTDYEADFLDVDSINWKGFRKQFDDFWDMERAEIWLTIRASLFNLKGLAPQEKTISLDLIATGITAGIWADEIEAVKSLKEVFNWLKDEVKSYEEPLDKLIKNIIKEVEDNAFKTSVKPEMTNRFLQNYLDHWYGIGWLLDKPKIKDIKHLLQQANYKFQKGKWIKRF